METDQTATPPPLEPPPRLASLDAWRGLVMFLMMAEIVQWWRVAENLRDLGWPQLGEWLARHTEHVAWSGCSLHDMIQPSFSFLVGAAMVFSLRRRREEQSTLAMTAHACWRAFLLVALGIWLRSLHSVRTNFTFEDTLTQIGLGYPFLFLLALTRRPMVWWIALAVILVGTWIAFALHPLPPPDFNYATVGVPPQWAVAPADFVRQGFAGHWNMNTNAAAAFDRWFLNRFPREGPFLFNSGGYCTLNFIPTLATMLMGLIGGTVLTSPATTGRRFAWCLAAAALAIGLALLLDATGACPIVKRIWTPSWVLFSGGLCFLALGVFHVIADAAEIRGPFLPFIVLGANSIAAYLIAHLWPNFIGASLRRHLPVGTFDSFGKEWAVPLLGACVLVIEWLILAWMHRRRIHLRL